MPYEPADVTFVGTPGYSIQASTTNTSALNVTVRCDTDTTVDPPEGFSTIEDYTDSLVQQILDALSAIPGLDVQGTKRLQAAQVITTTDTGEQPEA